MIHPQLFIGTSGNKGRGIFTSGKLDGMTVVEVSPVIVMSGNERKLLDQTLLHDYIFEWQPGGADQCCMALGWVPLYNHSYTSNCEYFMDYDEQIIYIQTMRPIDAGEELTINYNGEWDDERKVWFEAE